MHLLLVELRVVSEFSELIQVNELIDAHEVFLLLLLVQLAVLQGFILAGVAGLGEEENQLQLVV